jgi:hypothetical protein
VKKDTYRAAGDPVAGPAKHRPRDLRTDNADVKAGKKGRHIGEKGSPIASVGGVPGYNKGTGTPGWIRKAADRAEGFVGKDELARMGQSRESAWSGGQGSSHQDHAVVMRMTGAPPYAKRAEVKEKIHGGQSSRLGKDTD